MAAAAGKIPSCCGGCCGPRTGWTRPRTRSGRCIFTLTVIANFAVLGMGMEVMWVNYLPLPPLFLLLLSGLYLFALPYFAKRRGAEAAAPG